MKLGSMAVLTLSLAFAGSGALSSLIAQDAFVASAADVNRCVKWMRATVPAGGPDPEDFCSGVFDGNLGGWGSLYKCGQRAEQLTGTAPRYCVSSGEISAGELGRPDLAPQRGMEATFLGAPLMPRKTRNRPPLRSIAERQFGWEASGCLQECTGLFLPSRRMGGVLPLLSRTENGTTPNLHSSIWEALR